MGNKGKKNTGISRVSNKLVFSKYAGNLVGGAELSLEKMICSEVFGPRSSVSYLRFQAISKFGLNPSAEINIVNSDVELYDFVRFKYFEYILNRRKILQELGRFSTEYITYGHWSAYLSKSMISNDLILLLRSTQGFGISPNPHYGFKRIFYLVYRMIEYPFYIYWSRDFKKLLKLEPLIIANSKFIAERFYEKWGVKVNLVDYPHVIRPNLGTGKPGDISAVLFVGDNEHKGLSIFNYLAKKLPNYRFICYSRVSKTEVNMDNVTIKPWSESFVSDLIKCKLLIVPSQCEEAYGRVSRERYLVGGGLLVSQIGGLPETVDYQKAMLVKNYRSKREWLKRVKEVIE